MSIASATFLFLFLPIALGVYFLLPQSRNLLFRNLFLIAVSLSFYAWGEPVFILLLTAMIILTWLLGKMADGRQNTRAGNFAVFLVVVMNVGVLLSFAKLKFILDCLGILSGEKISFPLMSLPIGMSFFAFHSISYVVDIYRGQCKTAPKLLDAALYLSVFFKMLQGPIIPYHEFEPQIVCRKTHLDDFSSGIWRFAVGFCKKMMIASNLALPVKLIFSSDFTALSSADAWLGCAIFLIMMYFDFSGYSDMAIGLAKIFGFKMPENFNYPYISTSIGEYWRRWHITLCAWFRDYLYFPIVLGPSVSFRKFLLRHHVSDQTAKTMQNIFVPSCVWLVTALWHGTNWNYTIWGLVNSCAMIVEPHIKSFRNKRVNSLIRWVGVMLILLLTVPLICTDSFAQAALCFKAMFAGTGNVAISASVRWYLKGFELILLVGAAGCFPVLPLIKQKMYPVNNTRLQTLWNWTEGLLLMAAVVLSLGCLFKTGTVTFMYQQ